MPYRGRISVFHGVDELLVRLPSKVAASDGGGDGQRVGDIVNECLLVTYEIHQIVPLSAPQFINEYTTQLGQYVPFLVTKKR